MRALELSRDADALDALWKRTLGGVWPIRRGALARVASGGLVVDGAGGLEAVALTSGSALVAVCVASDRRRQGLARELLRAIEPTSIGAGGATYLWPGVPTNLPEAIRFFRSLGWAEDYICWDYAATFDSYRPATLRPTPGIRYMPAPAGYAQAAIEFNEAQLPEYNWARYFVNVPLDRTYVALDDHDEIVGSLLLEWSGRGDGGPWQPLLGQKYGTLGAVGVHPAMRGRGIGTSLVTHATKHLQSLGATACHVGWLVRTEFYDRCGFSPWRSYQMLAAVAGSSSDVAGTADTAGDRTVQPT